MSLATGKCGEREAAEIEFTIVREDVEGSMSEPRHPDDIMTDLATIADGEGVAADVSSLVWEVISDILDSVKLACISFDDILEADADYFGEKTLGEIYLTVSDYVTNHYGDD